MKYEWLKDPLHWVVYMTFLGCLNECHFHRIGLWLAYCSVDSTRGSTYYLSEVFYFSSWFWTFFGTIWECFYVCRLLQTTHALGLEALIMRFFYITKSCFHNRYWAIYLDYSSLCHTLLTGRHKVPALLALEEEKWTRWLEQDLGTLGAGTDLQVYFFDTSNLQICLVDTNVAHSVLWTHYSCD
jgi:hypothetical protein